MNQGEDHNNDYVCDANTTASFRVAYEVAEQHHAVEDVNSDQLVKGLHVVVKPRLEWLYPLNRYDQEGGDHELEGDLSPEELGPEHKCQAQEKTTQEEYHCDQDC